MKAASEIRLDTPGKIFFYPCAGRDWKQPLSAFSGAFDRFVFVDLGYQFDCEVPLDVPALLRKERSRHLRGPARSECRIISPAHGPYRDIEPAWLHEEFIDTQSGHNVNVTRRRGFGQYALDEFEDGSLGMFFHRGDSSGEGGSNTWFFSNHRFRDPVLGMLFDKVKRKLANPAYIATDGSNVTLTQLLKAARGETQGIEQFTSGGLHWELVGILPFKEQRNTVIWRVSKTENGGP